MIQSGELKNKLSIETLTITQDTRGTPVDTWTEFANVWGAIKPISGREYFDSQTENTETTHRVIIRFLSGLTTKMRINHGGRLFDIESIINPKEQNRELILMCIENG